MLVRLALVIVPPLLFTFVIFWTPTIDITEKGKKGSPVYLEDKDVRPAWKSALQNYFEFPDLSSFNICFINKSSGNPNYEYKENEKRPVARVSFTSGDPEQYSNQVTNRSEFYGTENGKEFEVANAGRWCFPYLGSETFSYGIVFFEETIGGYDINPDDRWWKWYEYKVTRSTDYIFLVVQFLLATLIWMLFLQSIIWSYKFIKSNIV